MPNRRQIIGAVVALLTSTAAILAIEYWNAHSGVRP
jgi:hypothetical protein